MVETYKLWQEFLRQFPQTSRYTLGAKIDALFVEIIESLIIASYQSKAEKLLPIERAITKLDILKFFLQISWEVKALDNKKYILLSEKLNEIGRMLGGWRGQILKKLSRPSGGREVKRVSDEDEPVVPVPEVVGIAPVRVQPPIVIVVIHVEDVRIAAGVGSVQDAAPATIL